MRILVIGGTGTVGTAVVNRLVEQSHQPRVLLRSADRARTLPPHVDTAIGDLEEPATLPPALAGMDGLFLLAPVCENETAISLAAVQAARSAGVSRIVYLSVIQPPGSERIPHFASKLPVERAIQDSGASWTILRPNNFFQNDLRLREAITRYHVYPQPLGARGLNRVDVRDIADAAANAFTDGVDGIFPLNGPRGLTGDDTARVYREALGRPVRYAGDNLDAWAAQVGPMLPGWMVRDFRTMYEFFIQHGAHASGSDFAAQQRLLGRAPRTFEAFVAELAPAWKAA